MEGSFSNPSAAMAEHTLDWLCAAAAEMAAEVAAAIAGTGDEGAGDEGARAAPSLLELYCGNGNHTVALARHFGRLLAVEIDPRLCEAAEHNLAQVRVGVGGRDKGRCRVRVRDPNPNPKPTLTLTLTLTLTSRRTVSRRRRCSARRRRASAAGCFAS